MLVEEDQAEVALQMDVKNKNLKIKKKHLVEGCLLFCIHLQPKLHFWAFKQSRLSQSQTESDNALRAKNISLFCQLDFLSQTTEGST